jgi:hypothetical protein
MERLTKRTSGGDYCPTKGTNEHQRIQRLAALCDAEQREKGCRYCNGNISDALGTPIYSFKVQYFEIGDGAVHMLHARYCPMCGRPLKGGKQ